MGVLRKIALGVLVLCLVVFVALFGRLPALRTTPIGFLHRCIWLYAPRVFRNLDKSITGGRVTPSIARLSHHLLYEKHPVILIFFLAVLTGPSALFLYAAWSRLSLIPHRLLIPMLLPLPYLFTYLCASSHASQITPATHAAHLRTYPYDHTLYHPHNPCRTCHLAKPARSKHCSVCRACVARADHHCVWVNNCLGATNYRYFLALLASLGTLLTYGAALAYTMLARGPAFAAPSAPFSSPDTNSATGLRAHLATTLADWSRAIQLDLHVGGVGLLAALTAPLAWLLLAYHVYLVWAGMTTNETGKWADLRELMADGLVWRRRWEAGSVMQPAERAVGAVPWPVRCRQRVVAVEEPGAEQELLDDGNGGEEAWERCWDLGELDNLYDVGFWHNLKDALNLR